MCKSPLSTPQEHPPARAPGSPRSRGKQRPGSLWEVYLPRSRTCLAEHLRPLTPFPGAQLPPTLRQGWSPILEQGWRRPGALLSLHPQTPSSNLRRLPNPSDRPCWIRLQTKSDGLKMRTRGYSWEKSHRYQCMNFTLLVSCIRGLFYLLPGSQMRLPDTGPDEHR